MTEGRFYPRSAFKMKIFPVFSLWILLVVFLLPRWVLSPKAHRYGCHLNMSTSLFLSSRQCQCTVVVQADSSREAMGRGEEGERAGRYRRLHGSISPRRHSPWLSWPPIALPCDEWTLSGNTSQCRPIYAHLISNIWFIALSKVNLDKLW